MIVSLNTIEKKENNYKEWLVLFEFISFELISFAAHTCYKHLKYRAS